MGGLRQELTPKTAAIVVGGAVVGIGALVWWMMGSTAPVVLPQDPAMVTLQRLAALVDPVAKSLNAGTVPTSAAGLPPLVEGDASPDPNDGWGNAIALRVVVQGRMAKVTARSRGADGAENTPDDYVLTADLEESSPKNWVMQAVNIAEPARATPPEGSADGGAAGPS